MAGIVTMILVGALSGSLLVGICAGTLVNLAMESRGVENRDAGCE